ncbi:hypothetical protein JCM17844_24500 [Iodidimonas gelatinilytica]|uniref:Uncharacterized protein n=1 Tax=Iodidimonas gelatinilytica TaxID=1236966 RepID=A0A5A7MU23_9PROT|nr:hypothetical protein [Iodidimonas gelatinilytica]GEQ98813.1 hypothetical protein JCM17844_24500 [Iodidimonas gelatinilytica]GER01347.1 hypothetical protein JCM17845_19700 [Iodidimonas gelatinilytica]
MSKNDFKLLSIRAGHHARRLIRKEGGLEPARIKLMVGASGGPKWLALARLDRAILRHWIVGRTQPWTFWRLLSALGGLLVMRSRIL